MSWTANDGVRYGIVVPQGWRHDLESRDFEAMVAVAREAERVGFDSIWLYDHLQLDVLRKHCDDVGRGYDEILRTASFTVSARELGSGELRPLFERLAVAGISYFIVYLDPPTELASLGRLAAEVGI